MTDQSDRPAPESNRLPVLPPVTIKTPCPMKWDDMAGDASKRFCESCQKHVHNFSEMDAGAVSKLLGSGQSICAKLQKRADGTIVTREASLSRGECVTRRGWFLRLGALAASLFAVLALGGCREQELQETTGIVAPPPSTQAPEMLGRAELGDVAIAQPGPATPQPNQTKDILGKIAPCTLEPK